MRCFWKEYVTTHKDEFLADIPNVGVTDWTEPPDFSVKKELQKYQKCLECDGNKTKDDCRLYLPKQ